MAIAKAGELEVFYLDEGRGEPVVLIHGHTLDHRMWDAQVRALIGAGYRVVRLDLRGHGRSSAPPTGYAPEQLAADVKALLDQLGLERAHIVGLSRGGGVALAFALAYPDATRSVTFVDSILPGRRMSARSTEFLREVNATFASTGRDAYEERWFGGFLFDGVRRFPDAAAAVRDMIRGYSAAEMATSPVPAAAPPTPSLADRLSGVRAPAMAVVGEMDEVSFHDFADELAERIPGARKVIIADAGHMANMERPETFNSALLNFLGALRA